MEQILLDCYLKYMKDNQSTVWKRLSRRPWYIILLFVLSFVSLIASLILNIFAERFVFIPLFIAVILTFLLDYFTEKYAINRSGIRYQNYLETCDGIRKMLAKLDIVSEDSISIIALLMNDSLEKKRQKEKERRERTDKWMQVLIIPVVLAIITAVIGKQSDISAILSYVFSIIIIMAIFYGTFLLSRSVFEFRFKRRTEQLQCFVDDLRSIQTLDSIAECEKKKSDTRSE